MTRERSITAAGLLLPAMFIAFALFRVGDGAADVASLLWIIWLVAASVHAAVQWGSTSLLFRLTFVFNGLILALGVVVSFLAR